MDLLAAARLLCGGARVTVPHELGSADATVVALDCRGRRPMLIAVTDHGREVVLPIDSLAALGGGS